MPSIKQSMVVQIAAVYASKRVKELLPWGQTDSEVEFNESMALHLLENFFFQMLNVCPMWEEST